jgi:protocatechuate 3,4-dioxygenase beta subunit
VTDADGWYQFQTIKPGAYPWGNHHNVAPGAHPFLAVRAEHPHASGHADVLPRRPAAGVRPDLQLRAGHQCQRTLDRQLRPGKTIPSYALGYRWDIVLRGRDATPMEK